MSKLNVGRLGFYSLAEWRLRAGFVRCRVTPALPQLKQFFNATLFSEQDLFHGVM